MIIHGVARSRLRGETPPPGTSLGCINCARARDERQRDHLRELRDQPSSLLPLEEAVTELCSYPDWKRQTNPSPNPGGSCLLQNEH